MNQPCSLWLVQAAVHAVDRGLGLDVTGAARPRGLLRELEWQDPAPEVSRVLIARLVSCSTATKTPGPTMAVSR